MIYLSQHNIKNDTIQKTFDVYFWRNIKFEYHHIHYWYYNSPNILLKVNNQIQNHSEMMKIVID